ncbi:hypothetical protein DFP72DRAFT_827521 [Ephemerocybe angulata]|uniref:Uncharacterized protein n=1 Tax=Ephemerocybe angulata TaxID=980116 RepID=A0A8H6LWT6_9AGAR|nr:hypothetical protein DFP72DRAFT_827521 [Tulosesus angulatus]
MSFYDFCRCIRLELQSRRLPKNTPDSRLGVLARYPLLPSHPLHSTHVLVRHTDEDSGDIKNEYVPKIIGMSIPRASSDIWPWFTLVHFKPFSISKPLIIPGQSIESVYDGFQFTERQNAIMQNWEAIYECEDERDADRLRKQASQMTGQRGKDLRENLAL